MCGRGWYSVYGCEMDVLDYSILGCEMNRIESLVERWLELSLIITITWSRFLRKLIVVFSCKISFLAVRRVKSGLYL
jgi:hypothetical protein